MSHTPGPWRYERATDGFRAPDKDDFQIVAQNSVCPGTVWGGAFTPEGKANARLIAAAPDLLEALKALATAHQQTIEGEGFDAEHCDCPVLDDARAAIAKATRVDAR